MIKLIITDDHKLVRDGLKALLSDPEDGIQVVAEASSGKHLIEMLPGTEADVILMDIGMPEMNGLEATQYIKDHFPQVNILMLSMMEQEKYVAEAIKAGALGYLLKTTDQAELIHGIKTVARGEQYISTQVAIKLLKNMPSPQPSPVSSAIKELPHDISKREMEVLQLIAQGYTNAEIADQLFTSKRTVESHRQSLLEKTASKNTACLIMYASKHNLLEEKGANSAGG